MFIKKNMWIHIKYFCVVREMAVFFSDEYVGDVIYSLSVEDLEVLRTAGCVRMLAHGTVRQ